MQPDSEYHSLTVVDVIEETADSRSFVLEITPELERTFGYAAGQFCTFRATIDGESVGRCYSMSSSPDTGDRFAVTVKRVDRGRMSNWMNDTLAPGAKIDVMRPAGLFVLRASEAPIVAFAGGSGITPIMSIIKSALATTSRDITLVYANRGREDVIFAEELERLCSESAGRLRLHHHLDSDMGFLDADACAELIGDRADADFYVCGPAPYMDVVEAALAKRNVGEEQLFIERFVVADDTSSTAESSTTESMTIRLSGRNHVVEYQAGDTILETARRAALKAPFSCEAGSCATCMAHVDEGSATMRVNNALTPDEVEEGWVLTCQALPTSREIVVNYDL